MKPDPDDRRIPPAEATEHPWWVIIDPSRLSRRTVSGIASAITGPFFSRESAELELAAQRYNFGTNAGVYCHTGHDSDEWRAFCEGPADPTA